jgi:hypothetical protein
MPRAITSSAPSRNQLTKWEKERDKLALKLANLEARIDAGRTARIPALPHDIMRCIFEYFERPSRQDPPEEDPPFASLHNLCCGAKEWLAPCRSLLYRSFHATNKETIDLFGRTLEEQPDVRHLVRYIYVTHPAIDYYFDLMPMVEVLYVYGLEVSSWDFNSALQFTRLRHVTFDNCDEITEDARWDDAYAAWPHLETLTLIDSFPSFPNTQASSQGFFPSLRAIEWLDNDLTLDSIPPMPPNTLSRIKLHRIADESDSNTITLFLGDHIGSLERLEITSCCGDRQNPFTHLLSSFSQLKTLRFSNNNLEIPAPMSLPRTLAEVEIDWLACTPTRAMEFIRQRTSNIGGGGPLRKFHIVYVGEDETEALWSEVRARAESWDVDFLARRRITITV